MEGELEAWLEASDRGKRWGMVPETSVVGEKND